MATIEQPDQAIVDAFVGASHGDLSRVRELAEVYPALVRANATWSETALGAAAHTANAEIVRFLLSKGADLDVFAAAVLGMADHIAELLDNAPFLANARGAHGIPLIFHAAAAGHRDVCQLLLDRGADVNAGAGGNTALHGAALSGRREVAELLLARGADRAAKNYDGKTALEVAQGRGHVEVARILER